MRGGRQREPRGPGTVSHLTDRAVEERSREPERGALLTYPLEGGARRARGADTISNLIRRLARRVRYMCATAYAILPSE